MFKVDTVLMNRTSQLTINCVGEMYICGYGDDGLRQIILPYIWPLMTTPYKSLFIRSCSKLYFMCK